MTITTDAASGFLVERAALVGCALWFIVVAWRLVRQGDRVTGGLSLGLVVAAMLAQLAIGPGTTPNMRWEYVATVGSVAGFVVIGGAWVRSAWRPRSRYAG